MITFYGYAVKKDGKWLSYKPKRNSHGKLFKKQFCKIPMFPVVSGGREFQERDHGHLGEVVRVKLTMEEEVSK